MNAATRLDPHSYTDSRQPVVTDLALTATIDFATRTLSAEATLSFAKLGTGPLDLDTRDLHIIAVVDQSEKPLEFLVQEAEPILGARLTINLSRPCSAVRIRYRTSPDASALQWLTAAQTFDGTHPFVFSQCQAIHARSIVPLQDTPRHRLRYRAALTIPKELKALMAARQLDRVENGALAVERFEMPEPIPPYLLAFAVGKLASRDIGPRSRVWAEPSVLDKAANEFADVEAMMVAGEKLFGPYSWERFDLLVMPRSFPYGGMENPRLTFITPTLIAGDRSLVSVVAHELAHSWTGNLVTNASAEHFWLNEGFTVYAERRIVEVLYGPERATLEAALGLRDLQHALEKFSTTPALTLLRTQLQGIDPDETFSEIPYEKGYFFLRALEEAAGRDRFDLFLRDYIARFAFQSISTEEFLTFAESKLAGALQKVNVQSWLFSPGVPASLVVPASARLALIEKSTEHIISEGLGRTFSPTEWQLYLASLRVPASPLYLEELDRIFQLSQSTNYEILGAWLELGVRSDYAPAIERTAALLAEVGRMKYLKPLYAALIDTKRIEIARALFERHRQSYHPIAQQVIATMLRSATLER